jgi:hypothetical protein
MATVKTIGKKNPGSNKIRKGENIYSIERFWISDSGHKKMGVLFTKKSSSSQADFSLSICTILPPAVDTSYVRSGWMRCSSGASSGVVMIS